MKFGFRPSPNYRSAQSTTGIMADLTACLLAVLTFSAVWYGVKFGAAYGLRVILMAAFASVAALATEAVYFKMIGKNPKEVFHSYGWVTAIILTLITRIEVSYYAVIVATVIAVVFGKLVFGGFGQNIFNPAAFGEALIMNTFGSSTNADFVTGATPVTEMAGKGWMMTSEEFGGFITKFGGLGNMLTGNYTSVIGATCAILILLCGAYLIWKEDIDWHLTCVYLVTVFALSLIVGLIKGAGLWYAVFNVLSGGVLFGAVFMITDPVTTPVSIPGRVVFAVGTACLTLIIRWKANLPDGVLFSILLMNMLTPAIDKIFDGNQIKQAAKFTKYVAIISAVCIVVALAVGATL